MLSVAEAIARLRAAARPLQGVEQVALGQALGRVLATDIVAPMDVPPAANSAMDGYAFRHADAGDPSALYPVSQRIVAGGVPQPLVPGSVARIFTGAGIPPGADTVVMQEDCDAHAQAILIRVLPPPGDNVRPRGQDLRRGARVLAAGRRLLPQDIGLLASLGLATVKLRPRLKVAVASNGDELVELGTELGPGQIYNSNRYLLQALLADWGFEAVDLGIAPDQPQAIEAQFRKAVDTADVVLSCGGVSVGEEDHVKQVVAALGRLDLWKIAVKPGKPLAFGEVCGKPFIGLPGNPSSALVTCLVFARPFLFDCQGRSDVVLQAVPERAAFGRPGGSREEYLRVRRGADGLLLYPNQSSGVLASASWGDGLARQAVGQDIEPGGLVEFVGWSQFF